MSDVAVPLVADCDSSGGRYRRYDYVSKRRQPARRLPVGIFTRSVTRGVLSVTLLEERETICSGGGDE